VKKILSIILALGLVLGMTLAAVPAVAQTCEATVTVDPDCAGETAEYCIEFESEYSMLEGNDEFAIEFPAGTTFDDPVTAEVDMVSATATVDGLMVYVSVPNDITAGDTVDVCIDGVINPADGDYTLNIYVDMLCCPLELIGCGEYTIAPKYSTYKFVLDFSPTYAGMAEDFIPWFKACGQDEPYGEPHPDDPGTYTYLFTSFNVTLKYDTLGCYGYNPVIINFELMSAPAGATAHLVLYDEDGTTYYDFLLTNPGHATDPKGSWGPPAGFPLLADHDEDTMAWIHFDIPGEYEICWELEYLGEEIECQPDIPGGILVERCEIVQVMQDKDVFPRPEFDPKWNFFSTPVRLFDDAIESVFAPVEDNLVGIYHWDNVQQKWFGYATTSYLPGSLQSLSTIEDGKGYLVRMKTDYEGWDAGANDAMWLFGHAEAYAPSLPFTYNVAEGWTMMGYTNLAAAGDADDYLLPASAIGGGILALDGNSYSVETHFDPGYGYWVYFSADGQVVPGSPAL
jgi:hypothetical protein